MLCFATLPQYASYYYKNPNLGNQCHFGCGLFRFQTVLESAKNSLWHGNGTGFENTLAVKKEKLNLTGRIPTIVSRTAESKCIVDKTKRNQNLMVDEIIKHINIRKDCITITQKTTLRIKRSVVFWIAQTIKQFWNCKINCVASQ
jgi:hypothetical protein